MNNRNNWIPSTTINYETTESGSWFDILLTKNDTSGEAHPAFSKKIELFPTVKQQEILSTWFDLSCQMYNLTAEFIRNGIYTGNGIGANVTYTKDTLDKNNISKYVNFSLLRDVYMVGKKKEFCNNNNIPVSILDQSIKRCVSVYQSYITNIFKGYITSFRVRKIKDTKPSQAIVIDRSLFPEKYNGFCVTILGEMKSDVPFDEEMKTSILKYNKSKSTYHLSVPVDKSYYETTNTRPNNLVCGIDPGARTFLTVYSDEDCLQICNMAYNQFQKYYDRIDRINETFDEKAKQTRKYKKAITKVQNKINNKMMDMHYKVAKYLCSNYKVIKLGDIDTQNINSESKRLFDTLSHSQFRELLKQQCIKFGCKLVLVDEYKTTMICSNCGYEKRDVGSSKVYECNRCKLVVDRDINAAKNIRYK